MAKLDEMDPRWVVEERKDGANVGGWHWSEKDISNESRALFKKMLGAGPLYKQENVRLGLLEVRKVEGEAIALNRKGKRGAFFDFDFTLEWHGEIQDPYGYESTEANGTLTGNVDQDCLKDCEIEVSLESLESSGGKALQRCMQAHGITAVRSLMAHFFAELRAKYDPTAAAEIASQLAEKKNRQQHAEHIHDTRRIEEEEAFMRDLQDTNGFKDDACRPDAVLSREEETELQNELSRQRLEKHREEEEEERRRRKEKRRIAAKKTESNKREKTDEELLAFLEE
eukprot:TRINITY_DN9717_c0_g1_i1.p1 TRINITY_DN9717_c0_g1~~TRINITY_DN9717_c0_g1_i1.p1  ORF type:complete len:284 (+),score=67.77 TRINITY_DN9717_c0_g1_i1:58-909(+)